MTTALHSTALVHRAGLGPLPAALHGGKFFQGGGAQGWRAILTTNESCSASASSRMAEPLVESVAVFTVRCPVVQTKQQSVQQQNC